MIPQTIPMESLGRTRWTTPPRPEGPARLHPSATHIRDDAVASRSRMTSGSWMAAMVEWSETAYPETPSGSATADN
jgi:hypothetical protein